MHHKLFSYDNLNPSIPCGNILFIQAGLNSPTHVSSPLEGDSVIEENTIRENVVKCPFLLKSQNDKSFHCSQNRQAQVSCKNDSFDTLQNKSQGKIENRPKTSMSAGQVSEEPSERHMT